MAQALSFLLMPLITRLYSPFEMGDYALYVSITSIVGLLSNLRLDLAVVVAESERDAAYLVQAAGSLAIGVGLASLAWLSVDFSSLRFAAFAAISIAAIGINQTLVNWLSRKQSFSQLATRSVLEKITVLACGLGLAYIGFTEFGLVAAQTIGLVISLIYMAWSSGLTEKFNFSESLRVLSHFRAFPLQTVISSGLMVMALFLPSLLIAQNFDKSQLGQLNLTMRVFEIPIVLLGYTFSTVYYQHAQKTLAADRLSLFWRTTKQLSLFFIPPIMLVGVFGPYVFPIVFGDKWQLAGSLALWLAPYTAMRLLYVSQSPLLYVERKLKTDMFLSALLFASQIGGFYLGLEWIGTVTGTIQVMALLGSLAFAAGLFQIHKSLLSKSPT